MKKSESGKWGTLMSFVKLPPAYTRLTSAASAGARSISSTISIGPPNVSSTINGPDRPASLRQYCPILVALMLLIGTVVTSEAATTTRMRARSFPAFDTLIESLGPATSSDVGEFRQLMSALMNRRGNQDQIGQPIVVFDLVFMADDFTWLQVSPQVALHYPSVFCNPTAWMKECSLQSDISLRISPLLHIVYSIIFVVSIGIFFGALDFDGADDKVGYGDLTFMNAAVNLSFAYWINTNALVDDDAIWAKSSGTAHVITGFMSGTAGIHAIRFGDGTIRGSTPTGVLVNGTWVHIVVVYNGDGVGNAGRLQIYKGGVDQALTFLGTIPATTGNQTNPFEVGAPSGSGLGFGNFKKGILKIWTASLTAAEAAQEVNSFRPARTANLRIWSPYDDGTSAIDYSGNGNHGTVTGALQKDGPPVGGGHPVRLY